MANFRASRSTIPGVVGIQTITLPFTPYAVEIFTGPAGSTENVNSISHGAADGERQNCITTFNDGTNNVTKGYNDCIISVWRMVGSPAVLTEVYRVAFDSFGTNEAKFNVITASTSYQSYFRFWG